MSMTDEAEADEVTVVENILNGVYSHPVRVILSTPSKAGRAT
jgi:hypothetical protein